MCDNKELREAVEAVQPETVKIGLRLSQSRPLYEAFMQMKEQQWGALTGPQRRVVDNELRDFVLGGAFPTSKPGQREPVRLLTGGNVAFARVWLYLAPPENPFVSS